MILERPPRIVTAPEAADPNYQAQDDLRHRAAGGGRMRDSLFWEVIMPEQQLGFQSYLYLTGTGKAGFNVALWGPEDKPYVLDLVQGSVPDEMDFDDFSFSGMRLRQPQIRQTASLSYESEKVKLELDFYGLHDAFSFHQNPDGVPNWFALNRFEQTGWVRGFVEFAGRRIEWDRMGHRDHSWGVRDWGLPHHWKWIVAYTPDGSRIVNGWIWIARGEWGFAGYVVRDGELIPIKHINQHTQYDADMTQRRLEAELVDIRGQTCLLTLDRFGIVKLLTHDKLGTAIIRAACTSTIDGQSGAGTLETHWQGSYLEHLIAANNRS
jgi:hypothetical protein